MSEITRTALVPYSTQQMYSLVNDVEAYPEFLPWCKRSTIIDSGTNWMEAELAVHKGPVEQTFSTRNTGIPYESIQMVLSNGPFKKLHGQWLFNVLDDKSCKIEFKLDFELGQTPLAFILRPLFNKIATTMVDAFYQRARVIYGAAHD
ncbi:MAG: type II toxin-antitoxin system RatA family toxin [Gammaproteobacteria bacterium]|nr:type II toxin-antitoxin system RatA family toxin [Gammaproteobacteria bacterium]